MLQPKYINCLNGHKKRTHTYAVYKRPTSDLGIYTQTKMKVWKQISHANGNEKKAGVTILISDKIYFK